MRRKKLQRPSILGIERGRLILVESAIKTVMGDIQILANRLRKIAAEVARSSETIARAKEDLE